MIQFHGEIALRQTAVVAPEESLTSKDYLSSCLTGPHFPECFLGPIHREDGANLRHDLCLGNQVHHVPHVVQRAHDGTGDRELVADRRQEVQRNFESGCAAGGHQCAASCQR